MSNEIEWRRIQRSNYEVSEDGRVRRIGSPADRKPHVHRGYLRVMIRKADSMRCHRIHRLVYEAFVGPIPADKVINHIDGNKQNNRVSNLECISQRDNHRHALALGLYAAGENNGMATHPERRAIGEENGATKLTAAVVLQIRRMAASGMRGIDILPLVPVERQNLYAILRDASWRHLPSVDELRKGVSA